MASIRTFISWGDHIKGGIQVEMANLKIKIAGLELNLVFPMPQERALPKELSLVKEGRRKKERQIKTRDLQN